MNSEEFNDRNSGGIQSSSTLGVLLANVLDTDEKLVEPKVENTMADNWNSPFENPIISEDSCDPVNECAENLGSTLAFHNSDATFDDLIDEKFVRNCPKSNSDTIPRISWVVPQFDSKISLNNYDDVSSVKDSFDLPLNFPYDTNRSYQSNLCDIRIASGPGVAWDFGNFYNIEDDRSPAWSFSMSGSVDDPSSMEPDSKPLLSRGKRQEDKKCGVCGDRALGYNFNAVTCESCKAFFRRNALKNKDFRCPFNDQCEVTSVTRRFCQRCRLRKCFEIGMKKEWIMSEDDKLKKRRKIQINRVKKMGSSVPDENIESLDHFTDSLDDNADSTSKKVSDNRPGKNRVRSSPNKSQKKMRLSARASSQYVSYAESDTDSSHSHITNEMSDHIENIESPGPPLLIPKREMEDFSVPPTNIPYDVSNYSQKRPLEQERFETISHEIPSSTVTYFEDGLVANLLRSDSQSPKGRQQYHVSNEKMTSNFRPESNLLVREPPLYKRHETVPEISHTPHQNTEQNTSPCGSKSSTEDLSFSIQDALQCLQPGCRGKVTSYAQSVMDTIVNTAISAEYHNFPLVNGHLNEAEKHKISELFEANRGLLAPLCEDANFKDSPDPSLINVINLTEIAIRRLIKMSKKITAFRNLCQEDQIALLKAGCTELMILKSVSAYDPDKDSWKIKQDQHSFKSIKLKVLKTAPGNVYEEHKRFILAFKPEWRQDLNIMLLLSAIVLFTPERPFIIHPEAIRHEQSSYLYLLKRYLEIEHGSCEGVSILYKLIERISKLHILNEDHVRVFLEANPKEMEPLLIEIFDLKQS